MSEDLLSKTHVSSTTQFFRMCNFFDKICGVTNESCSKGTKKTTGWHQWCSSVVIIVNFDQFAHATLKSFLLTSCIVLILSRYPIFIRHGFTELFNKQKHNFFNKKISITYVWQGSKYTCDKMWLFSFLYQIIPHVYFFTVYLISLSSINYVFSTDFISPNFLFSNSTLVVSFVLEDLLL